MRISKILTEKVDVDFVIEIMQQNKTSKHSELREFLFLEDILPNISHKINKLGCNKNSLGETFFGGRDKPSCTGGERGCFFKLPCKPLLGNVF